MKITSHEGYRYLSEAEKLKTVNRGTAICSTLVWWVREAKRTSLKRHQTPHLTKSVSFVAMILASSELVWSALAAFESGTECAHHLEPCRFYPCAQHLGSFPVPIEHIVHRVYNGVFWRITNVIG